MTPPVTPPSTPETSLDVLEQSQLLDHLTCCFWFNVLARKIPPSLSLKYDSSLRSVNPRAKDRRQGLRELGRGGRLPTGNDWSLWSGSPRHCLGVQPALLAYLAKLCLAALKGAQRL